MTSSLTIIMSDGWKTQDECFQWHYFRCSIQIPVLLHLNDWSLFPYTSMSTRDKKKQNVSSSLGTAPSGQVGRFKNGMLILSSKEIQKIKGNKRRK